MDIATYYQNIIVSLYRPFNRPGFIPVSGASSSRSVGSSFMMSVAVSTMKNAWSRVRRPSSKKCAFSFSKLTWCGAREIKNSSSVSGLGGRGTPVVEEKDTRG